MGSDSSKATGTDFERNQASREADNAADDLPSIPYPKQKAINAELERLFKGSIWLANYKRAFRGYLRRRPERNQAGTMLRIHAQSMRDGDLLGLPKDAYKVLIREMVEKFGDMWIDDALEFLEQRGKVSGAMSAEQRREIALHNVGIVFKQMIDVQANTTGKKIYEKYSRGVDFEESDIEVDPETKARQLAEKQARIKEAALERQRKAEEWKRQAEAEAALQAEREAIIRQKQDEQKKISESALL